MQIPAINGVVRACVRACVRVHTTACRVLLPSVPDWRRAFAGRHIDSAFAPAVLYPTAGPRYMYLKSI